MPTCGSTVKHRPPPYKKEEIKNIKEQNVCNENLKDLHKCRYRHVMYLHDLLHEVNIHMFSQIYSQTLTY